MGESNKGYKRHVQLKTVTEEIKQSMVLTAQSRRHFLFAFGGSRRGSCYQTLFWQAEKIAKKFINLYELTSGHITWPHTKMYKYSQILQTALVYSKSVERINSLEHLYCIL